MPKPGTWWRKKEPLLGTEGCKGQFMFRQHGAEMGVWCESAKM